MARGEYGALATPEPLPPPKSGGWFTILMVAALGVGIYLMLPAVSPAKREERELERIAREKGFANVRDYEAAVLRIGRDLEAGGAEVRFGPHLAHLDKRL